MNEKSTPNPKADSVVPESVAPDPIVPGSADDPTPLFTRLRATPHASNDVRIDGRLADCLEEIGRIQDVLTVATLALVYEETGYTRQIAQVVEHVESAVALLHRELDSLRTTLRARAEDEAAQGEAFARQHASISGEVHMHLDTLLRSLPLAQGLKESVRRGLVRPASEAKRRLTDLEAHAQSVTERRAA